MKKLGVFLISVLLVTGCSNKEDDMNQIVSKYESQIEDLQRENQDLKDEIQQVKSDYSTFLQQTDNKSRSIMRLIAEGKFDQLKNEYNVKFEIKDGAIDFGVPESNSPFRIELAKHPMFISSFNKHSDGTEISYYIDNLETEERTLITMSYDKEDAFKFIFVGDR